MNTSRLNFTRLNTSVLNASLLNSSLMGGRGKGSSSRPSGLIAQYKPYLNSNDSPTRDILNDYSGHGNDVVLYNFAFAGMSGYGGYEEPANLWRPNSNNNKVVDSSDDFMSFRVVNGCSPNFLLLYFIVSSDNTVPFWRGHDITLVAGEYGLRIAKTKPNGTDAIQIAQANPGERIFLSKEDIQSFIEQGYSMLMLGPDLAVPANGIFTLYVPPLYPGALVSDGVDDYGICENFPILTKEKGYTVCAIRKKLDGLERNSGFLSNVTEWVVNGAFIFEFVYKQKSIVTSFSSDNKVEFTELFSYMTSVSYNGNGIIKGKGNATNVTVLFKTDNTPSATFGKYALYSLEIYDRDLSEAEIETVKQRMIAEYEKATGNILEPEENIWLWGDGDTVLWSDGTNVLTE